MQVKIEELENGLKITETIGSDVIIRYLTSYAYPFIRSTNEAGETYQVVDAVGEIYNLPALPSEFTLESITGNIYLSSNGDELIENSFHLKPFRKDDLEDKVITMGVVTASSSIVNVALHTSGINAVFINGNLRERYLPNQFNFTPVTTGIKVLVVYALDTTTMLYLAEGIEAPEAVEPAYTGLFIARLIVSTTGVIVENSNKSVKLKEESDWRYLEITSNATPIKLALPFDTRGSFYLTKNLGVGVITIEGIKKTSIAMSGDQYFYGGRELLLFNATGGDIIIDSSVAVGTDSFKFSSRITPFTVKNNTSVLVKLRGDVIELLPSGSGAELPPGTDGQIYEIDNSLPEKIKPSDRLTTVETNKQDKSLFSSLVDKMVHYYDLATQKMLSTGVEFISAGIMKFKSIILTTNSGTALANELGFDGVNVVFGATKKKLAFKDEIFEHNVRGKVIESTGVTGTYNCDLNAATRWILTLTGNTTIAFTNMILADETITISMNVTGDFTVGFPSWLKLSTYSDLYDGTKINRIVIEIGKGGVSPTGWYNIIKFDS